MAQYIDKDAVAEIVKKIFELLIEEDEIKSLLPKISNDASKIYEGFMSNLSDLYKYANSEYRDRIINVVIDNIMLDNLIEVKGVGIDEEFESKLAWSEEDEKMIETICKEGNLKPSEQHWLKSLKPNHWKPSEEQMEALKKRTIGLHTNSEVRKVLESLIFDLEKL